MRRDTLALKEFINEYRTDEQGISNDQIGAKTYFKRVNFIIGYSLFICSTFFPPMNGILTISLTNLRFFAYHGLYEEEKKTGNQFEVDLLVSYVPSPGIVTDISDTINYVSLYELLKKEMQQPRGLLETLAMEISEKIHHEFPMIKKIELSIVKAQPPIAQFTGKVGVKYSKGY